jgi:hypothetical protein
LSPPRRAARVEAPSAAAAPFLPLPVTAPPPELVAGSPRDPQGRRWGRLCSSPFALRARPRMVSEGTPRRRRQAQIQCLRDRIRQPWWRICDGGSSSAVPSPSARCLRECTSPVGGVVPRGPRCRCRTQRRAAPR